MSWYESGPAPLVAPPPIVPPNWYRDPSGVADLRWWDGYVWTPRVVVRGKADDRPMPPRDTVVGGEVDFRAHLPARAGLVALCGLVVGVGLSIGLGLAGLAVGLPKIGRMIVAQLGLWTGLLGACRVVSRRYGTDHPARDFGLRLRGADIGWGLLGALVARIGATLVVIPIVLLGSKRLLGGNDQVFRTFRNDTASFVVVALLAVVGAPIVEELFFRGVVQGSLLQTLGTAGGIAVQAVLFGLAHFNPLLGMANVTVIAAVTVAGVVFGVTARYRRLGSSIVAHAAFNLVAVAVAATL